jgi:hypothetical protein
MTVPEPLPPRWCFAFNTERLCVVSLMMSLLPRAPFSWSHIAFTRAQRCRRSSPLLNRMQRARGTRSGTV